MELYIGGRAQGKTDYVRRVTGLDAVDCTPEEALKEKAVNHFHLTVRRLLLDGGDPETFARALLARNPEAVIICDEVGMGVVPVDPFERYWRESVGRAVCILAGAASRVERINCGLPLRLK